MAPQVGLESALQRKRSNLERQQTPDLPSFRSNAPRTARSSSQFNSYLRPSTSGSHLHSIGSGLVVALLTYDHDRNHIAQQDQHGCEQTVFEIANHRPVVRKNFVGDQFDAYSRILKACQFVQSGGLRNTGDPCARSCAFYSCLQPSSLSLLIASPTLFDFCSL